MMLGLAYRARGDQKKAEEHLREAIGKKGDYADAHNNLGIVLADRKAWDEAIVEFGKAAENGPVPDAGMGTVYERGRGLPVQGGCGEGGGAVPEGDPDRTSGTPRRTPGFPPCWSSAGRREEAEAVLLRCVKAVPDYADGWMELGRAYSAAKRPSDAAKAFKTVLSISDDPEVRRQAIGYLRVIGSERQ